MRMPCRGTEFRPRVAPVMRPTLFRFDACPCGSGGESRVGAMQSCKFVLRQVKGGVEASPIPGALAAGTACGPVWGKVQVAIGAGLGALIAFGPARVPGHDVLRRLFGDRVDAGLLGSRTVLTATVFASRPIQPPGALRVLGHDPPCGRAEPVARPALHACDTGGHHAGAFPACPFRG